MLRSEQAETGGKIIGTKLIDVYNGDFDNPRIRCRLVGKEFRTGPEDAIYASTPAEWQLSKLASLNRKTWSMMYSARISTPR